MSDRDDQRDLSDAFEALSAPRSTAAFAQREPRGAITMTKPRQRWPQALAGVLVVLIASAGAGTFLALRHARQDGGAATSAGSPPARAFAAMAWDSTADMTVMYGGTGGSGRQLHDTWLWDGSAWKRSTLPGGPGTMAGAHMSDDPADGGVLLVGTPVVPATESGGVTGCLVAPVGTASATGGSAGGAPVRSGGQAFLQTPAPTTPAPTAAALTSLPPCPAPAVTLSVQTWLFTASGGWHRATTGGDAVSPAPNADLAYDGASHEVVAVATTYFPCGGRLASGIKQPMLPCELTPAASGGPASAGRAGTAASGGGVAAPQACTVNGCPGTSTVPCSASFPAGFIPYICSNGGRVSTWVWSGGHWSARPVSGPVNSLAVVVVSGAAGGHALLVAQTWTADRCHAASLACASMPPSSTPLLAIWEWSGSVWQDRVPGIHEVSGITYAGSSLTSVDGTLLVVGTDGTYHTLDHGTGTVHNGRSAPRRSGEAMAEAPSRTVVLFGGLPTDIERPGVAMLSSNQPGSDTWRWDGHSWTHLAGSEPPVQSIPTPCSSVSKVCVVLPGVPSPLPAPANPSASVPAAPTPAPSASPTGSFTFVPLSTPSPSG